MTIKTKLQDLGFNLNHFFIMAVALIVFGLLVVPRTNLKLSAMFSQAQDSNQEILTYDQVRNQVYAELGVIDEDKYQQELENQFALLDRGQADGAVLGAAIGLDEVPSAEQLFSNEQLALIPVKAVVASSQTTVQKYADQMLQIENYFDTTELFANLNSSDPTLLNQTTQQTQNIINDMAGLDVPSDLVTYHKYNVLYYQTIGKLGQSFANNESNLAQYSSALFSLMDRIANLKVQIEAQYNITL